MKRFEWIDSCRFLAMFYIMLTHFFAKACPDIFRFWYNPPTSWLLSGFIGKLFLIYFFVVLGFFASKPDKFNPKKFLIYCLRRYLQLAFYIFVSTLVFIVGSYVATWIFHSPDEGVYRIICDGFKYNLIYLFRDSFLMESSYNSSLWCIPHLVLGSIICKVLSYIPQSTKLSIRFLISVALMSVLLIWNIDRTLWICIAILGYVLRLCLEFLDSHPNLTSSKFKIALLLISIIIIKIPLEEGNLLFALEAIVNSLILIVLFHAPSAQRVLSKPPLPRLGGITIGLFVAHPLVYSLFHSSFYSIMHGRIPEVLALAIYFIISLMISILFAFIMDWLYGKLLKISTKTPVTV